MKTIDIYANGPEITFETIDDLKANEKVRKTLFNDDGSIKDIFISENPYTKKNPLNHRFRRKRCRCNRIRQSSKKVFRRSLYTNGRKEIVYYDIMENKYDS